MRKSTLIAASLQRSGLLLLGAFFIVFVYTTLHEGGHALAGLLSGGTVSRIDVNFFDLSAHAVIDGTFTRGQQALIAVAGWALPVLTVLLVLLLGRAGREPLARALRWVGGVCVLASTLPWVVLPLIYLGGGRPADDVTHFLGTSGIPPLLAALFFAALVAGGAALIVAGRGQIAELRAWLGSAEPPMANRGTRRTLVIMALLVLLLAGGLLLVNRGAQSASIPPGYELVQTMDLAQATPDGTRLYAFDKARAGPLGVLVLARDVRSDRLDISLRGPDGWSFALLRGEGYSVSEDRSNPSWEEMPAGHYEVVLSGSPARGEIWLYVKQ